MAVSMLALSGCWSYHDVEDRTIVAGAAVDLLPSGNVLLTAETISFGSGESGGESEIITSQGADLADAISRMSEKSGRELYWHHATVIVLSREYAERGVEDIFDYIMNHNEARLSMRLAVARIENARDVFELETYGSKIKSYALTSMLEESEHMGSTPSRKAYENINAYLEPGMEMLMPTVYEDAEGGTGCAVAEGCAIFKGGRLSGMLDRASTEMLLLLRDEVRKMEMDIELEDGGIVTIMARRWRTKTQIDEGKVSLDISARYRVMQARGNIDLNSEEGYVKLNTAAAKQLKARAEELLDTLRACGTDSLGWNRRMYIKDPKNFTVSPEILDQSVKYGIRLKNENVFDSILK